MKFKLLIICIIIACIAAAAAYKKDKLSQFFSPKPHTSFEVKLQETREIDKLYTGVYLIPVLDRQYGELKRDVIPNFFSDEKKEVVKAYCIKKYEVSMGYDNITALLSDQELIHNVCTGRTDKLPEPQILTVNSQSGPSTTKYSSDGQCHRWDKDKELRNNVIRAEMQNSKILDQVNKRGRESLKSLASLFCE